MATAEEAWKRATLPAPFYDDPWRGDQQEAARAFWAWHRHLSLGIGTPGNDGREAMDPVATELHRSAEHYCMKFAVDVAELDRQIPIATRIRQGMRIADVDELDAVVRDWTGAHARLLAGIIDIGSYSWQKDLLHLFARGYFLTAAVMALPDDMSRDSILFPLTDLEQTGVAPEELARGEVTPTVRKLLWKEVVRARDSFAQAQKLIDDLSGRQAASFRRWWFAGVEMLNQIEANKFDVWNKPPTLSLYHRLHVRFQARFGRTTFR